MAVTADIKLTATVTQTKDVVGSGTLSQVSLPFAFSTRLADGTAINQIDRVYHKKRTVTAASPESIDLSGTLEDAFGDTVVFAKIVGIFIKNLSTTPSEIISVGGGSNALINWIGATGDIIKIGPGGAIGVLNPAAAGYAVTAATGDLLQIDVATGTNVPYEILIIGRSA